MINTSNTAQPFPDRTVRYQEGEETKQLRDKTTHLGKGAFATVYPHRSNPQWVVKTSVSSLEKEHAIGLLVDHPCVVKTEALYIETFPDSRKPIKYKLVQHKIDGLRFEDIEGPSQDPSKEVKKALLLQAKDCCHHLFQKRVAWDDLGPENVFVTPDNKLRICDLGLWTVENDTAGLARQLLNGAIELSHTIVGPQAPMGTVNDPCYFCQILTPLTADITLPAPSADAEQSEPYLCVETHAPLTEKVHALFERCADDAARLAVIDAYFDGVIERL